MFPAACFRLNVFADLGEDDSSFYVLVLDAGSIVGILYSLTETLSARMSDGTIDRCTLAAELVEILRPMAIMAELSPPDCLSSADATLWVQVREETENGETDAEVLQLKLQVSFRYKNVAVLIDRQAQEGSVEQVDSEINREIVSAALREEWDFLIDLDGFVGSDRALFRRLNTYMQGRAVLAKRLLFLRTLERAQNAVLGVYVTHDARGVLDGLTRVLERLSETEARHQDEIMKRARMADLQ
jgi:hypothetical protein